MGGTPFSSSRLLFKSKTPFSANPFFFLTRYKLHNLSVECIPSFHNVCLRFLQGYIIHPMGVFFTLARQNEVRRAVLSINIPTKFSSFLTVHASVCEEYFQQIHKYANSNFP